MNVKEKDCGRGCVLLSRKISFKKRYFAPPGVFSQTFDVTLPRSIMGISGSCVTVPCRFKVPNNMEATLVNCSDSGVWRRGETFGPTVFTARKPDSSILKVGRLFLVLSLFLSSKTQAT